MQGRRMGPVSYILAGLAMRYGQLGDESRLQAITEFQCFHKYPGERIDEFLSRFNVVRIRAEQDGGFHQSIELHALQLMRSMNLNPQQFSTFLTPFGLRLPNTVREFEELQSHMRRIFTLLNMPLVTSDKAYMPLGKRGQALIIKEHNMLFLALHLLLTR